VEVAMRRKISDSRNKFEDLIQMAKNSEQGMDFLYSSLSNLVQPLQNIIPAATVNKQDEFESFLGGKIPQEVEIHPPNDINSRGQSKRIKKSKEKKAPRKRMCGKCKQLWIMTHVISQTMLSVDISSLCNLHSVRTFKLTFWNMSIFLALPSEFS
jgi:hypothetical protein